MERIGYLEKIPIRFAIGPSTAVVRTYKVTIQPCWYLIPELVRALNATLDSRPRRSFYDQGTEISVRVSDPLLTTSTNLHRRSYPVDFWYFGFAYGTTRSSTRFQAANILVIFSPFDRIALLLLAASSFATIIIFRFGGCTSPLLTGLPSFAVQGHGRDG